MLVVQTVNLNEFGELVQDLISDAKDYDSRSVSVVIMYNIVDIVLLNNENLELIIRHRWEKGDSRLFMKI